MGQDIASADAPAPPRGSHRFRSLDGWRGICSVLVVLFHLHARTHLYLVTRNAWVAVDFFFVLSGFVLMSASGGRVENARGFGRFTLRRLVRLYPLHLATLAVLFAVLGVSAWREGQPLFTGTHGLGGLLQCLLLVQGFTLQALSWNYPSWSISLELWASLLLGLALWVSRSRAWTVFAVAAAGIIGVLLVAGEPDGPASTEVGALLKAAHYLMAFAAGVVLFKLFAWVSGRGWRPPPWMEWLALVLLAGAFLWADGLDSPATVALFSGVILVFAFEAGPVSAFLRRPPLQALGRWSYSIYLVHPFWTLATFKLTQAMGGDGAAAGAFAMDLAAIGCVALVIVTAALTYRFIERPGIELAKPTPLTKNQSGTKPSRWTPWSSPSAGRTPPLP